MMNRRDLFRLFAAGCLASAHRAFAGGVKALDCDIAVIGGGLGGVAAALAALRCGKRVVLTEETDWIGGQMTQQGVPPDEHPWIEEFGSSRSYREVRSRIREYYRRSYPLAQTALQAAQLNPGNCSVSKICHEPRVALAVLEHLLLPHISSGKLVLLLEHEPLEAFCEGDTVRGVVLEDSRRAQRVDLAARLFIDATETGELLPLSGTEYVTGFESARATGEPHAPQEAQPLNMQAITWCFCLEYRPGETWTIDRPPEYDFWRAYEPNLKPAWPGRLLSWTYSHPITLKPWTADFDPTPGARNPGLWRYRRLADPGNFAPAGWPGICLINWPQNDFWLGNVIEVSPTERSRNLERARELSRSLCYWLQTEAPRPDGGQGWPGLRLRGDLMGTGDGLAKRAYIRESRRIKAEFTVAEQHVATEARKDLLGRDDVSAESFPDAVCTGSYRIDLHPSTGGDNYLDISSLPFEVPLGCMIPERVANLLPASKNIGTTHITNGCFRLHPVEWVVGEVSGHLAAYCLELGRRPREVRNSSVQLELFQKRLTEMGIETRWPDPLRTPR